MEVKRVNFFLEGSDTTVTVDKIGDGLEVRKRYLMDGRGLNLRSYPRKDGSVAIAAIDAVSQENEHNPICLAVVSQKEGVDLGSFIDVLDQFPLKFLSRFDGTMTLSAGKDAESVKKSLIITEQNNVKNMLFTGQIARALMSEFGLK